MAFNRSVAASLFVLAATVVFAVVLGFVLAFQPAKPESVEERWAQLEVAEPEVVFLGDLTKAEQAAITRELKSAQVAHNERFGVVTSDFTLYMSTDLDALNEAYRKWLAPEWRRRGVKLPEGFTCSGLASRDSIFIALESCSDDLRARGGPVAHEYFHILQHHLGLVGHSSSLVWPTWLTEGSAVYASVLHEEEQGRLTVSTWREVARLGWAGLGLRFPGPYEQAIDGHTPSPLEFAVLVYQVGFLAIEWLVERTGEEALVEFFQLGGGRQEFEKAFGMAADEFVAAFEEHRLAVAPPFESRIAGRVVNSDGKPVAFARVDTHIWIGQEPAWAGGDWTNTLGRFSFKGPDDGYTLKLSLRCPGGDFYDGRRVHAGEWGREGFVPDEDGQLRWGDKGAEPFTREAPRPSYVLIQLPETPEALIERHCE